MPDDARSDAAPSLPLLLRHLRPLADRPVALQYDRAKRLNVLAGTETPAVSGGVDVKTIGVSAED